jgi:hypothetical protein
LPADCETDFRDQAIEEHLIVATRQEITDAIDTGIAAAWPEIQNKQEAYRVQHGRYFQGLCTHSEPPADGQPAVADQLDTHPDYQAETWLDVNYDTQNPRAALAIDQYVGPQGMGYVCSFRVTIAGELWRREINVGPATYLDAGWRVEED